MTRSLGPILLLLAAIWIIEILNSAIGHSLNVELGLRPRDTSGLVGIPFMPLLHTSFSHAFANSLPLIVLGTIGYLAAPERFWRASVAIVFFSGLAIWLMSRPGFIVGSSGLIFGWFGFIIALGAVERSLRTMAGAVLVIFLYGGMIWGILPEDGARISWEAHLLGALTGAAVAYLQPKLQMEFGA